MKNVTFVLSLVLIGFASSGQVLNADFENWYTNTAGRVVLQDWEHLTANHTSPSLELYGTWRDSASEHGLYALRLSRWYSYTDDWARQKEAISSRPFALNGSYKYIDNELIGGPSPYDTAMVQVFLTKWNSAGANTDTIGRGEADLTQNVAYTAFQCPISYVNSEVPDSIIVNIFPTKGTYIGLRGVCAGPSGTCSYLTVDHLSLAQTTGISASPAKMELTVFPNPVSGSLYIESPEAMEATLVNSMGALMSRIHLLAGRNEVDVYNLPAGLYVVAAGNYHFKILKL